MKQLFEQINNISSEELLYFFPEDYIHVNFFLNKHRTILFARLHKVTLKSNKEIKAVFFCSSDNRFISCHWKRRIPISFLSNDYIDNLFVIEGVVTLYENVKTVYLFFPNIYPVNEYLSLSLENIKIIAKYKGMTIGESIKIQKNAIHITSTCFIGNITKNEDKDYRKKMFISIHNPTNLKEVFKAQKYFFYERSYFRYITFLKQNRSNVKLKIEDEYPETVINQCYDIELSDSQIKAIKKYKSIVSHKCNKATFLYGEVGSGKTFTFLSFALIWLKNNFSVLCISPTSILNEQNYTKALKLREKNISIQMIGEDEKNIKYNEKGIFFSTTKAFFNSRIEKIYNLGLIIIDEEHKFGIKTKLLEGIHFLYVTATPIPRLMNLSKNSFISTISLERKKEFKVTTEIIEDIEEALDIIQRLVLDKKKSIIIAPFLEHKSIEKVNSVELIEILLLEKNIKEFIKISGKLELKEQKSIIDEFSSDTNDIYILLGTPVIEIGIDIPNIDTIFIFGPEQFGLAQLHQFRGRIGRNGQDSNCYLVNNILSIKQNERLKVFSNTTNSMEIMEWDSLNRGYGDISGKKQVGMDIDIKILEEDNNYLLDVSDKEINFLEELYKKKYEKLYLNLKKKYIKEEN